MINPEATHNFIPAKRQDMIIQIIKDRRIVRVDELSEHLHVTEMTIRRDLQVLEKRGVLERTHGGAVYSDRVHLEPPYTQKTQQHQREKEAIGRLASTLIAEGDTVFVNSGTTTLQFLRHLSVSRARIVTNNPWIPLEPLPEGIKILLTGGELRRESFTLVGEAAIQSVNKVFGTKAIIGVDGFSLKHGITTPVQEEALLNGLMIEQTHGEVIVVADSSKFGKVSNFLTAQASSVDTVVTDAGLDEQYREGLQRLGIRVLIAETGE